MFNSKDLGSLGTHAKSLAANAVGTYVLPTLTVLIRKQDGATADTYSNYVSRVARISTPTELKAEVAYFKSVLSEALPSAGSFLNDLRGLRANVSRRLIQDLDPSFRYSGI